MLLLLAASAATSDTVNLQAYHSPGSADTLELPVLPIAGVATPSWQPASLPVIGPGTHDLSRVTVRLDTLEQADLLSGRLNDLVESGRAGAELTVGVIEQLATLVVSFDPALRAQALASIEGVLDELALTGVSVDPVPVARALVTTPNDPFWSLQWGMETVGAPEVWSRTVGSSDIVIAVIDTGVNVVSELAGRVLPGWDFVDNDDDAADPHGHGTMSATVIAAAGNNGAGIAGVCWQCRILPVRVLGTDGTGTYDDIAAGIVYAADQGVDVINLSLGGPTSSQMLDEAVAYARDQGVLVVASAGNDNVTTPFWPAASPGALSVAGSDESDLKYSWSNYGTWVDVAAPGCNPAQDESAAYVWYCGTSSAGPVVAGIAALALSDSPALSGDALHDLIISSSVAVTYVSAGRVDAAALMTAIDAANTPADVIAPAAVFLAPGPGQHLRGQMTFSASVSDDVAVTGLELWSGSTLLAVGDPATGEAALDTSVLADGPVTLRWRAYDAAGNVGVVQRSFVVDNTAPSLLFGTPQASTSHSGWVTATPQVTDVNLRRVELWVGGVPSSTAWQAPWSSVFDSRLLADGPVELRFRAHDRAGNVSVVSRQVVVSNTEPAPQIDWPNPGRVVRGDVGVNPSAVTVAPVASSTLLVDGVEVASWPYLPQIATWDTRGHAGGRAELEFRVTDQAGNTAFSPARVVEVDNTPPQIAVLTPNPGGELSSGSSVTAEILDPAGLRRAELWIGAELVVVIDTFSGSTVTFTLPGTVEVSGQQLLRVVAFDAVGNRSMVGRVAVFP